MTDNVYRMDSHKLYWHLDRVQAWMNGERIAPLHIDVGLSKGCNIRCHYCFGALQGNEYKKGERKYIAREPLLNYMRDAGKAGVRSMAIVGEAEPLINPHVYEAIQVGKAAGVDMGLGTNGVLYDTGAEGEKTLENLTWLRFNISAASKSAYQRLHNSDQFDRLMENVKFCIDTKQRKNLPITIGFQMVLTPQDVDEALPLTRLAREMGVDYLEIKHCADTVNSDLGVYDQLEKYDSYADLLRKAESMSENGFRVVVKWNNITKKGKRNYTKCLGPPFMLYSSGDGRIYPCGMFFSHREEEFRLGDITENSFVDIVNSEAYWSKIKRVEETINVQKICYASCKTNAINEFLNQLKNPPQHINFI